MVSKAWRRITSLVLLLSLCLGMGQLGAATAAPSAVRPASHSSESAAPGAGFKPTVRAALKHDLSPELLSIKPAAPNATAGNIPLRRLHPPARGAQPSGAEADSVLQSSPGIASMPVPIRTFEGIGNVSEVLPPDTEGDVGPNHYVQFINLDFAVWDKSGTLLYGPAPGNTLWAGFGGPCETTNNGDPIVQYDHLADRWMLSQFGNVFTDGPYYQCIAVSKTGDPTGAYYRYAFEISDTKLNDYPKFGVWPDAYYMTINQFLGNSYAGAGAIAFERGQMLAGRPARMVYFDLESVNINFGGMLPSDLDGPPPPPGSPNYFAEVDDSSLIGPNDAMRLWRFHVDWANPANSTFGQTGINAGQPNNTLNVASFTPLCPTTSDCIPQPGTTQKLDAIGDRLMYRLQYRNFGSHQSLVVNHTVDAGAGRAGVRWYEVYDPGGTPAIHQQGTYAPSDTESRWMASAAQDRQGNLAIGFSASSSTVFPAIRYAGRLVSDPLNNLSQGEAVMQAGGGSQTHPLARWGDYSMLAVDSTDDCTFWYTNEYLPATSDADWHTRIGAFKFPGCTSAPTGGLQGTVTKAAGGGPIAGALVQAGAYSTFTDASGHYQFLHLPIGTYTVTASAYGYAPQTAGGIVVTAGVTATHNFSLTALPVATVQGTVTDGSGHNWPLYARIDITGSGYPGGPVFTDPVTGHYSVTLLQSTPYSFTVSAISPGYNTVTRGVTPPNGGSTENFTLTVDALACVASGYRQTGGIYEAFESGGLPSGWSIVDNIGNGQVWKFNDPGGRTNLTGGSGGFAIVDSDYYGPGNTQDTELRSPPIDLSGQTTATLQFDTDFRFVSAGTEVADVDVSANGGTSWTNVWKKTGADYRGPTHETVDITSVAANQANVRVRFHYYDAHWAWWWEVDSVQVGQVTCSPQAGGLLVGNVYDANTNTPLDDATVSDGAGHTATTIATPADPAQPDGFYTLFTTAGAHTVTASAPGGYANDAQSVNVTANTTARKDFHLKAGRLGPAPASITLTMLAGQTTSRTVTISNSGSIATSFNIAEVNAPAPPLGPTGPFAQRHRHVEPEGVNEPDALDAFGFHPPAGPILAAGGAVISWTTGLAYPWGIGFNTTANDLWVGDIGVGGGDDKDHRFHTTGVSTTDTIDTGPWIGAWAADMTFDSFTGKLWQVNVGGDNCIHELDPVAKAATGATICPDFGTTERGLAFNPLSNTFYSGSWIDGILNHFDVTGALLDSTDLSIGISGLALNPSTGHLFAMTNHGTVGGLDVYVYDTNNGYALVGGFNIQGMSIGGGAGLEIDCAGHLWAVDQDSHKVIEAASGETGVCDWKDVPWLSESPTSGSIPNGGSKAITLTFNATNLTAGTYRAHLRLLHSTPYNVRPVDITLRVLSFNTIYLPLVRR